MSLPNGTMIKVTGNDLDLPNLGLDRKPPQEYAFNFTTSQYTQCIVQMPF
jgi:hypothetical protein